MNRTILSRASILLLAAVLLASPVFAAGPRPEREPGLLAAVWQLLARIAPSLQKGRQMIDPDGVTASNDTEGRQMIDPNGATADDDTEGRHTIDPNG